MLRALRHLIRLIVIARTLARHGALTPLQDAMDALIRRNSLVQAFLYTPAHLALESAARMFPLYRQAPVLIDDRPLMTMPGRGIPSTRSARSGQSR